MTSPNKTLGEEPARGSAEGAAPVLSVRDLAASFVNGGIETCVLAGVSFELFGGETLVLLGESGSGKTLTARCLLGLTEENCKVEGRIDFASSPRGEARSPSDISKLLGHHIALVPQAPGNSLDPLATVGAQIGEVLRVHKIVDDRKAARTRVLRLLVSVGIGDPERVANAYPHQLSGGMIQRSLIAMALSCEPEIIVADEPTTGLDVTIQAQILDLLVELQESLGTALLFITHDVDVAREIGQSVAVMYHGAIVEYGRANDVLGLPAHPYTRGLLGSVPGPEAERGSLNTIAGSPPNSGETFPGCPFAPRCPYSIPECTEKPPTAETVGAQHWARCIRTEHVRSGGL